MFSVHDFVKLCRKKCTRLKGVRSHDIANAKALACIEDIEYSTDNHLRLVRSGQSKKPAYPWCTSFATTVQC